MSVRCLTAVLVAALLTVSCSGKPETEQAETKQVEKAEAEQDERPGQDEIAEDCVGFVRATKIVPSQTPGPDCATCAAVSAAVEILAFRGFRAEKISCSADTCEVAVTIRAAFNSAPAGTVTGGLTAWLSPEQRAEYATGHSPAGEQTFPVKVTYKRRAKGWRAVEFDRAN